ncbi:MAG: hypothetical protein F6K54_14085 [Okeania sp. SIO3B5]|uniref:hypothetical protein n=1 Tax=Okeania sp. SIO3B5 TaxID=2607811 RepID=UPI0013FEAACA|nr:hypothetical protein [Okeania sp. SIO3B5]NEO54111.1 hypothetical protein [Okeania sp. SIO3B5]
MMEKTLPQQELTEEKIAELLNNIGHETVNKAVEEFDIFMEQILAQTGLTEEEYVSMFMNAVKDEE